MNSKTAQLRENGAEIVRLFARFALGASFLSAVADRFGLWGPIRSKAAIDEGVPLPTLRIVLLDSNDYSRGGFVAWRRDGGDATLFAREDHVEEAWRIVPHSKCGRGSLELLPVI